jgi:hypothetical protein
MEDALGLEVPERLELEPPADVDADLVDLGLDQPEGLLERRVGELCELRGAELSGLAAASGQRCGEGRTREMYVRSCSEACWRCKPIS